jgi:hypothetical protein
MRGVMVSFVCSGFGNGLRIENFNCEFSRTPPRKFRSDVNDEIGDEVQPKSIKTQFVSDWSQMPQKISRTSSMDQNE